MALAADGLPLPERALPALEPILRNAAQQSPRMLTRTLDLEMAEQSRIQARAGLLPSLGASYRLYRTSDDRADLSTRTDATKSYYDISLNQPLFHWGERVNNARIGEIQKLMAEGNYQEGYRQLIQELRQKYGFLVVMKQQLQRARVVLTLAQQQVQLAEQRLAKKEISDLEIYPIRLNLEQSQINLERTEWDFANAKHTFSRMAGINPLADADIPDAIPTVDYPAELFNRMLAGYLSDKNLPTAEAVNLRRQLEIEDLSVKNQRTRLRPKVGMVVGMNQDEQSYSLNTAQKYRVTSTFAGIQVNWTIFDGFASQAATRNALAKRRQVENEYNEALDRLTRQAQSQVKQINFAARSMAITDRALVSGEGNLRAKQEEFRRGTAAEADVTWAEIHLIDAKINAFGARMDYLGKVGEFLGTLNDDPVVAGLNSK
jgi:outer membrane protein TolC